MIKERLHKDTSFIIHSSIEGILEDVTYSEFKLVLWLMFNCVDSKNTVYIDHLVKARAAKSRDVSISFINTIITSLVKKGLLERVGVRTGKYLINYFNNYPVRVENSKRDNVSIVSDKNEWNDITF